MGVIYKITNTVNGKVYIGQTTRSLNTRWRLHKSSRSFCRHLLNAIKKYGADSFTIEPIDQADTMEELNRKECEYIAFYNSIDRSKGYNLMSGGGNSHHSEETKRKLRENSKRMWKDPVFKMLMTEKLKKANGSDDARRKHKNSCLEMWSRGEYREKIIKTMQSNDYREKQRKALKALHNDNGFHSRWYEANKECHGIKIECEEMGQVFASITDAAKAAKCSDTSIRKVLKGVRKTAGGYHWRYVSGKE